jgi:hypothetical protein
MVALPAHPFPLIRAGGLFLAIVGIAILLGALLPRRRWLLLAAGAALAAVVVSVAALPLSRPLGVPTRAQVATLFFAVLVEVVAIAWVRSRLRTHPERSVVLAVLLVVGLHFLPMGVAFGPLIAVLGVLAAANAGVGLLLFRTTPLALLWVLDGLLKSVTGVFMFALAPRLAWG